MLLRNITRNRKFNQEQISGIVGPLIQKAYELMTSNPEECLRLAESALKISQDNAFSKGIAYGYLHIGLGKFHLGEYGSAMEAYKLAEERFIHDNDYFGLRNVYNNIGVIYTRWKDREKALEYYQKNLSLSDRIPDPVLYCTIMLNIGKIHGWSNDYDAARDCYQKALKVAEDINNDSCKASALSELGVLLINECKPDEALDYFNRALMIRAELNNTIAIIFLHRYIAAALKCKGNHSEAIIHLQTAMQLSLQLNDKYTIATISESLADFYQKIEDFPKEKEYLDICLLHATEQGYKEFEVQALGALAQWYEREGDYKTALQTYWHFQTTKDFLLSQNKIQTVQQMRVKMQVEEKEREMELMHKINLALEKKNKLINRQKNKLEKAEKALIAWNHTLETRVNDEMKKRQEQEQIVIQKSKLESLGSLAAGIAHEINQPLGMINIGFQNLFNKLKSGKLAEDYIKDKETYFSDNIDRIKKIIEHIRLFSRDQQPEAPQKADLTEIISSALSMIQMQCRNHNITIDYQRPDYPLFILGSKFRLEQVILNLLSNAKDALEEKYDLYDDAKYIRLRCFKQGNNIITEVTDNGSGIREENIQKIFEPFYTTKTEAKGTGLGLSICYGIIHEMEGSIYCSSSSGEGTTMTIALNACGEE